MKRSSLLILTFFFAPVLLFCQADGSSCASPLPILMDGVSHSYTISSATGSNLVCTSTGTTPVTYFSLVANSSAQKMILKITGPNTQPVEVAFYDGTSCTNGNLETVSSICFYDGHGDWATAASFTITANKTYILRIKTSTTGSIQILGQYYTPPNTSCQTATPISTILTFDNNATHPPAGLNPATLCTGQLNNTAFYSYTVDVTGTTGISIENMEIDNNYQGDLLNLGFAVGLFTGSCAGLTSIACYVGVSANAQINAGILPAGTTVYVAIDGLLGTNCDYGIRAINALVLSATLKYFTVWKNKEENIIQWISLNEEGNAFFEVQRSIDGSYFTTIDRVDGQVNSTAEKSYQLTDASPPSLCYYRLKLVDINGKSTYSKVIRIDRKSDAGSKIKFNNIVTNQLSIQADDLKQEKVSIKIIDASGREVYQQSTRITNGGNSININTSGLSGGLHYLIFSTSDYNQAFPFIKF